MMRIRSLIPRGRRGAALVMVLMIVAILTALTVEFNLATKVDIRILKINEERQKAYYVAKSGVYAGEALLVYDLFEDPDPQLDGYKEPLDILMPTIPELPNEMWSWVAEG